MTYVKSAVTGWVSLTATRSCTKTVTGQNGG